MDEALSLADIGALIGPNNQLLGNVVEKLATSGDFTEDGIWVQSNAFGKHVSAERRSLPTGADRMANRGVPASKGVIGQNEDFIGFFESPSVVDDFVLRRTPAGQKQAARSKYDIAHALGLGITQRTYSFYGDPLVNINQPKGLSTRRNAVSEYCLDAGMSGTKNVSLYLVGWDQHQGVHNIYPDGEDMGINMQDMDINIVIDPVHTDSVRWIPYWITWFYLDFGLVVLDDRSLVRIANINPESTTQADYEAVYSLLNQALRKMKVPLSQVRIYGNSDALSFVDNMSLHIQSMNISPVEIQSKTFWRSWNSVPLRLCEELKSNEAAVS